MKSGEQVHNPSDAHNPPDTSREQLGQPGVDYFDLTDTIPQDFAKLHHDIYDVTDEGDELRGVLFEGLAKGFRVWCLTAPNQAGAGLGALAAADNEARHTAAILVHYLAEVDREVAMAVFAPLMEDPNDEVAEAARESLATAAGKRALSLSQVISLLRVGRKRI